MRAETRIQILVFAETLVFVGEADFGALGGTQNDSLWSEATSIPYYQYLYYQ